MANEKPVWLDGCGNPYTPTIADGTSQPWAPPAPVESGGILVNWPSGRDKAPAKRVWTEAEVVELLRSADGGIAIRLQSLGVGPEAAGDAATAYFKAARVGDPDWRATNGGCAVWRNEVEAVLAVLNAGAEKAPGVSPAVVWLDGRDKPPADPYAAIEALNARVSELLLERDEARRVGEEALTRAAAAESEAARLAAAGTVDRRFELVKTFLAGVCDGERDWADGAIDLAAREAVQMADAVLAALGAPAKAHFAHPGDVAYVVSELECMARLEDERGSAGSVAGWARVLSKRLRGAPAEGGDASAAASAPAKGPAAEAKARALAGVASARSYLDMGVEELSHHGGPAWGEAAEALRCAALCLDEARAAVKAAEGGGT